MNTIGRRVYGGLLAIIVGIALISIAYLPGQLSHGANAYTVNSTADTNDGSCDPFVEDVSDCTLREALIAANVNKGPDTVTFAIDESFAQIDGQWQIVVTEMVMSDTVTITGASAWNTELDIPGIRIENTQLDGNADVFYFQSTSDGSHVAGLELVGGEATLNIQAANVTIGTNCDGASDAHERNVIHGAGSKNLFLTDASTFRIQGNYIGVESDGITPSGTTNWGINIVRSSDTGSIGFVEGSTCDASLQRNIIGASGGQWGAGVEIAGSAQNIHIAGNWIGIGADGTSGLGDQLYAGVKVADSASNVVVGTDGDGTEDASEKNYIAHWNQGAFARDEAQNVRISGNTFGLSPDGSTPIANKNGIIMRMDGGIVGWCDEAINATVCSNNGSTTDQANVILNGERGIRFARGAANVHIYGNYIGTDTTETLSMGPSRYGMELLQSNTGEAFFIGGSETEQSNTITNADIGIFVNGQSKGDAFLSLNDYQIVNNVIQDSVTSGMHILGTELFGSAPGPSDGTIDGNTISGSGGDGILIEGSSPTVQNNVISNSTGYGISVRSSIRPDIGSYNHPTNTLSPSAADEDAVAQPRIDTNTIDGNAGGGIYIVDAAPEDAETLHTTNTIGVNGSFDVQQDWYIGVSLQTQGGDAISADGAGAVLIPTNDAACTQACLGNTYADPSRSGLTLIGSDGVSYDDATTWFQITGHRVDENGSVQPYTYRVSTFGNHQVFGDVPVLTIDGAAPAFPNTVQDGAQETDGVYRYRILTLTAIPVEDAPPIPAPTVRTNPTAPTDTRTPISPENQEPLVAPSSMVGFATSDSSIYWYARNEMETAYKLYLTPPSEDVHILEGSLDKQASSPQIYTFTETNLEPETTYCDRDVFVSTTYGESERTTLPCVTTLAPGETFDPHTSPRFTVEQEFGVLPAWVERFSASGRFQLSIPLGALIVFAGGGFVHAERRRRQQCSTQLCRRIRTQAANSGLIVAIILFAGILLLNTVADSYAANHVRVVTQRTTFAQNDRIRAIFHVTNVGMVDAEETVLHVPIPDGLTYDPESITVFSNNWPLLRDTFRAHNAFTTHLGTLTPGETLHIDVDLVVNTADGEAQIRPTVSSANAAALTVEGNPLYIGKRPRQRDELKPLTLVEVWESDDRYLILPNGTRALAQQDEIVFSWLGEQSETIDTQPELLGELSFGGSLRPRPGTWLLTTPSNGGTYAVTSYSTVQRITSKEVERVYGPNWQKRVLVVPETLLGQYTFAEQLSPDQWPEEMVINHNGFLCRVRQQRCQQVLPEHDTPPWIHQFSVPATPAFEAWFAKNET